MAEKKKSLENIIEELGVLVERLENDNMSLEDSYQCFSEGVNLVMEGNKSIDKIEKKMQVLSEEK